MELLGQPGQYLDQLFLAVAVIPREREEFPRLLYDGTLLDIRPPLGGCLANGAVSLLVAGVAGGALAAERRPTADRPPGFGAMYAVALLFPLPVFLFTSPYAAVAGMTMAHGLQYLLLVALVAAGTDRRKRAGGVMTLCALALVGGTVLNLISHLHGSGAPLRLFFGVYLGLLAGHFVVGAGAWRLRDPAVRAFLGLRVPYLVSPGTTGDTNTVADRSVTDIESLHAPGGAPGTDQD